MSSPGTGFRQGGASIVMYRMGGREYPLKVAPNCKVCKSPHRFAIEQEIIGGRTYKVIERALPEGSDLSSLNIKAHYENGHMPLDAEVSRRLLEHRAAARGLRVEETADSIVDGLALAELTVQKTYEAVARGEIKPDLKDGLAAAKMLEMFGFADTGADEAAYVEAFMVYHEGVSKFMPPAQREQFAAWINGNPTLRRLKAEMVARRSGESQEDQDDTPRVLDSDDGHEIELGPSSPTPEPQEGT